MYIDPKVCTLPHQGAWSPQRLQILAGKFLFFIFYFFHPWHRQVHVASHNHALLMCHIQRPFIQSQRWKAATGPKTGIIFPYCYCFYPGWFLDPWLNPLANLVDLNTLAENEIYACVPNGHTWPNPKGYAPNDPTSAVAPQPPGKKRLVGIPTGS